MVLYIIWGPKQCIMTHIVQAIFYTRKEKWAIDFNRDAHLHCQALILDDQKESNCARDIEFSVLYHQLSLILVKTQQFFSRNCLWKCLLQYVGHHVLASTDNKGPMTIPDAKAARLGCNVFSTYKLLMHLSNIWLHPSFCHWWLF